MPIHLNDDRIKHEEVRRKGRVDKVNRILQVLEQEFSASEMADIGVELWLVMQVICGPHEAAFLISRCQME